MKTLIGLLLAGLTSVSTFADPLQKTDPEYAQLVAMGYDLSEVDNMTTAKGGEKSMLVIKDANSSRRSIMRFFIRTHLDLAPAEELKFLQAINRLNVQTRYQIAATDKYIACALYERGPYDSKTWASFVRELEMCNIIFDKEPYLLELSQ